MHSNQRDSFVYCSLFRVERLNPAYWAEQHVDLDLNYRFNEPSGLGSSNQCHTSTPPKLLH
jgi:hypothetical protein